MSVTEKIIILEIFMTHHLDYRLFYDL